ncbi:MAG: ADOP family duplicated permease [Candidatus Angelobacter sp.]
MGLRRFFQRRKEDADLARELEAHVAHQVDENISAGMSEEEARRQAYLKLGSPQHVREDVWEWNTVGFFDNLLRDLRYALRMLRRNPGFSFLVILCLTLGIGANAAVFSWIEGVLFRPFPAVAHQERMVSFIATKPGRYEKGEGNLGYDDVSWLDFLDFQRNCKLMDWFIADHITGSTLSFGDRAEKAAGSVVSSNYFDSLGIHPILGRGFRPEEDWGRNGHPVTVISYWLWKERFQGDPNIVGKKLLLQTVPHTIIGVAPAGFYGTFVGYPMQFWVPASMQENFVGDNYKLEDRGDGWIEGFARLKPGVTMEQAQAEISAVAGHLEDQYPNTNRGRGVRLFPLWKTPFNQAGTLAPTLGISLAAVFLVLLIACANVSSLLLVRSLARQHEITIRLALGSRRGRVLRQLITEGLILSVIASACGLVLAYLSRNLMAVFFPQSAVLATNLSGKIDWRVLAFSAGVCVVATLIFALVPALQTSKLDIAGALKAESSTSFGNRAKSRIRSAMVLVQVALSFILVVGGALLVQSLQRLRSADPGFSPDNILTTTFDLLGASYDAARAKRFRDDLMDRVKAIPGVESVSYVRIRPFGYQSYFSAPITVEGYEPGPDERLTVEYNQVGPGYFENMRIPIVSGREFTRNDDANSFPAVIVNERMVARYWHGADPVGKRIQVNDKSMQVVGVAKDSKYGSFAELPKPFMHVCIDQTTAVNSTVMIRTAQSPGAMSSALAHEVHSMNAGLGMQELLTLREYMNRTALSTQKIVVALLFIFGGIALLLASVGLYGVMSFAVSQSKHELGLRMALGAVPTHLFRVVMSHGLSLAVGGVALGTIVAMFLTRLIAVGTLLYQVNPRNPMAFMVAALVMIIISLAACFTPAWHAARTDPMRALRD